MRAFWFYWGYRACSVYRVSGLGVLYGFGYQDLDFRVMQDFTALYVSKGFENKNRVRLISFYAEGCGDLGFGPLWFRVCLAL